MKDTPESSRLLDSVRFILRGTKSSISAAKFVTDCIWIGVTGTGSNCTIFTGVGLKYNKDELLPEETLRVPAYDMLWWDGWRNTVDVTALVAIVFLLTNLALFVCEDDLALEALALLLRALLPSLVFNANWYSVVMYWKLSRSNVWFRNSKLANLQGCSKSDIYFALDLYRIFMILLDLNDFYSQSKKKRKLCFKDEFIQWIDWFKLLKVNKFSFSISSRIRKSTC